MAEQALTSTSARELTAEQEDAALWTLIGQIANEAAASGTFERYKQGKAENTVKRQERGVELFGAYLAERFQALRDSPKATASGREAIDRARARLDRLFEEPQGWAGVTWGMVQGYRDWLLARGYALGTVNVRLATVRRYAQLAMQAGALPTGAYTQITSVSGIARKNGANVNSTRKRTRRGAKKAEPVEVTDKQAQALKANHGSDGRGRRDRLLMALLVDVGLRCSEIADLTVSDFVGLDGLCPELHAYRRKTKNEGRYDLTTLPDVLEAARAYFGGHGAPKSGPVFVASTPSGLLTGEPLTQRAIAKRVRVLGEQVGLEHLSPHDLRHYRATAFGERGRSTKFLMQWFGWSSPAMAVRYQRDAEILRA